MTLALLINGEPHADLTHAIDLNDRGFHYGDGVFETMRLHDGRVRFLDAHLARLQFGCERLRFDPPPLDTLRTEIDRISQHMRSAVVKIIVTRGAAGRGYRPPEAARPTRILALYPEPAAFRPNAQLRWCQTRLARNPLLAGIKHLNRLEQVLAQAEWRDPAIDEALMMDTEGELVCATTANVFIVRDGVLQTPDLRFSGVRGVMRAQVLHAAQRLNIACEETPLWPHDLEQSSEVFITSALRGVQSVGALESQRWPAGPIAARLREALC